ncbi:hypothetical protein [Xanthomonas phage XAJ2]|uniref:Uncharacterized protein n=1 Tax=Xanthomonas phage XAJ2 TaxID=1775249 RepID=A0A1I9L2I8_9CAUD|nr:hypothetical protein [Xanthomonas phage XAJ2]
MSKFQVLAAVHAFPDKEFTLLCFPGDGYEWEHLATDDERGYPSLWPTKEDAESFMYFRKLETKKVAGGVYHSLRVVEVEP